jgi:DNA ligase 1
MVKKAKKPQFEIPVFEVQLAHDGANHPEKIRGERMIEVKLDGVRVITILYPDGRVNQFSRNGKELLNFDEIRRQLSSVAKSVPVPTVLDGEVMSSSFQDLMRQVHRKSDVKTNDAVLNLFDMLPLDHFLAGGISTAQSIRSESLAVWFDMVGGTAALPNVNVLGHEIVDLDTDAGQQRFAKINADAVAGGYEGIMIKDPNAGYECKRTTAWLKQKPFIEETLEVLDVEEGTGKNLGRLGALVCGGWVDGKYIRVNVGSGFSDSLRDSIWADRSLVIGQLVEVRADAVTQNQDGSYSMRFPRFKLFRGFVPGEKI